MLRNESLEVGEGQDAERSLPRVESVPSEPMNCREVVTMLNTAQIRSGQATKYQCLVGLVFGQRKLQLGTIVEKEAGVGRIAKLASQQGKHFLDVRLCK